MYTNINGEWGAIIRDDDTGAFVAAASWNVCSLNDVDLAEAIASRKGLQLAHDM